MSLYLVDRFLYEVDADPAMLEGYLDDPGTFVDTWERERGGLVTPTESVSAHRFTDAERAALVSTDVSALYGMGAHPFLLFSWVRPILFRQHGSLPAVVAAYAKAIDGQGRPSWRT